MKKTIYPIVVLLVFLFGNTTLFAQNPGCDGSRYINNTFPQVVKTTVNYAPATSHLGQPMMLSMDVYEPAGDPLSVRPVVILAHGGSFIFGDKTMMDRWCQLLAKKGYVAATIQYRLYPFLVLGLPDSIDIFDTAVKAVGDMKAAVRYFREDANTANQFRVDANNIFIGGYSAGAVTALHTAYLDANDDIPAFLNTLLANNGGLEGNSGTPDNQTYSSKTKAVVNMSGGIYRSFWLDANEAPLTSIHGTSDETVPYTYGLAANIAYLEGSSLVHAQAEAVELRNILHTAPGAGHTNLYDQAAWQPHIDTFWVNTSTLLESLVCTASGVGVNEIAETPWKLFPNPVGDAAFTLQFPAEITGVDVLLYDLAGKLVMRQNRVASQSGISVASLLPGTYIVQLIHPERHFAPQLLVKN
ncbi:MAG: alpha/beta hydrolase fold domain-containing protein [Saprospiraceae bacterium]|nr:alpha/beta hydrolase fold domain-containing protein [Saprospiraceae bacterium]